jgi:hypothetical protein
MSVAGKRVSTIGPGHDGAPKPGFYGKAGDTVSHPHSVANAARGMEAQQHTTATLGVPPKPKRSGVENVPIHSGMTKQTKSGPLAFGGDHASAIDSLSGREVVPGKVKARAGYDNGVNVSTAHPLTAPPVAKNYGRVATAWNNKSRTGPIARSLDDATPHDICGQMLLDEAKS